MDTRGGNTWHTTEPWHNSPLPEGVSHAVTVPPGRGVGALEAPQDRHGQDHRMGTSRAEQITEAMAVQGALEAMAGGLSWPWPQSLGQATPAGTLLPPKKKFPGEVRGYQEPSRARQTGQYMTGQDGTVLRGQTDRTRHPTGTRSPPGWARKLRLPLGMTRSQGPSQDPSATASTTGGQAAGKSPWTRPTRLD